MVGAPVVEVAEQEAEAVVLPPAPVVMPLELVDVPELELLPEPELLLELLLEPLLEPLLEVLPELLLEPLLEVLPELLLEPLLELLPELPVELVPEVDDPKVPLLSLPPHPARHSVAPNSDTRTLVCCTFFIVISLLLKSTGPFKYR
jgi:hypothetical protein